MTRVLGIVTAALLAVTAVMAPAIRQFVHNGVSR